MADLAHPKLAIFRRRVFTALSLISMMLCLAAMILWWQSYDFNDQLVRRRVRADTVQVFWVESDRGSLNFFVNQFTDGPVMVGPSKWFYNRISIDNDFDFDWPAVWSTNMSRRSIFGVQFVSVTGGPHGVAIPHWLFALAFAVLPATYIISAFRTRRRHRIGLCSACGYDLRASPSRCPECGAIGRRSEDSG